MYYLIKNYCNLFKITIYLFLLINLTSSALITSNQLPFVNIQWNDKDCFQIQILGNLSAVERLELRCSKIDGLPTVEVGTKFQQTITSSDSLEFCENSHFIGKFELIYFIEKIDDSNLYIKHSNNEFEEINCKNVGYFNAYTDNIQIDLIEGIEIILDNQKGSSAVLLETLNLCPKQENIQETCTIWNPDQKLRRGVRQIPDWPPPTDELPPIGELPTFPIFITTGGHLYAWLVVAIIFIILTCFTVLAIIVLVITMPSKVLTQIQPHQYNRKDDYTIPRPRRSI